MFHPASWQNQVGLVASFSHRRAGAMQTRDEIVGYCLHQGIDSANLVLPRQTHSARVVKVVSLSDHLICDGLVCQTPGICLGIRTADCLPVFFYSPAARAIGLAHAGWRGLRAGILENMLASLGNLKNCPSHSIWVWIAPHIQSCCFEVDQQFIEAMPDWQGYAQVVAGVTKVDLSAIARDKLLAGGLAPENISISQLCTCCNPELCFSYRRDQTTGRHLSLLGLN